MNESDSKASAEQAELEKLYEEMRQEEMARRVEIVQRLRPLTAAEIGASLSPPVGGADVEKWRDAGRVFAVEFEGQALYPRFQFESGSPKNVIAEVLKHLRATRPSSEAEPPFSEWSILFWFVGANGWLEGSTPLEGGVLVDQIDSNAEAVIYAAEQARNLFSD